jgi:hypothetical protein
MDVQLFVYDLSKVSFVATGSEYSANSSRVWRAQYVHISHSTLSFPRRVSKRICAKDKKIEQDLQSLAVSASRSFAPVVPLDVYTR